MGNLIDNKYFLGCQRAGVFGSFFIFYYLAESFIFPINEITGLVIPLIAAGLYIWLIKIIFWDRGLKITEYSYIGFLYAIVGFPVAIFVSFALMISFGWAAPMMRSDMHLNKFDYFVMTYLAPLICATILIFIVIENKLL